VKWATATATTFVAQSGGHAWAHWFRTGDDGVVINMRGLNSVTIAEDKASATLGGGAIVGEVMRACGAAGAHVSPSTHFQPSPVPPKLTGPSK
jgi:FAD/FMN-containing dehydrogenase